MNLLDAIVTEIIDYTPYFKYGKWWVDVEYDCYGRKSKTSLMFDTIEEVLEVKVGYKFLT